MTTQERIAVTIEAINNGEADHLLTFKARYQKQLQKLFANAYREQVNDDPEAQLLQKVYPLLYNIIETGGTPKLYQVLKNNFPELLID